MEIINKQELNNFMADIARVCKHVRLVRPRHASKRLRDVAYLLKSLQAYSIAVRVSYKSKTADL